MHLVGICSRVQLFSRFFSDINAEVINNGYGPVAPPPSPGRPERRSTTYHSDGLVSRCQWSSINLSTNPSHSRHLPSAFLIFKYVVIRSYGDNHYIYGVWCYGGLTPATTHQPLLTSHHSYEGSLGAPLPSLYHSTTFKLHSDCTKRVSA